MQPIAINFELFESLFDKWDSDISALQNLVEVTKNLSKFHLVTSFITPENSIDWINSVQKLKNKYSGSSKERFIEDLLGPRNLKFNPIVKQTIPKNESNIDLIESTPDKLYLKSKEENLKIEGGHIYDLEEFISSNHGFDCILLRYPKILSLKYRQYIKNFECMAPFVRNAKTIEYFDPYLFNLNTKDTKENSIYLDFFSDILKNCTGLEHLILKTDMKNPMEIQLKIALMKKLKFEETIKKAASSLKEIKLEPYNKSINHDRFLIVDKNKYTISFSASNNNYVKVPDGFIVKKSSQITFSSGRQYPD